MPQLEVKDHSEEVQDIMGYIPHWVIRRGVTVLFCILLFLVIGSYFFKYPDKVAADLQITTINAPAPIIADISSTIEKWMVEDNAPVEAGQPLAVLYSGDNFEEVLLLEEIIEQSPPEHIINDLEKLNIPTLKAEVQELARNHQYHHDLLHSSTYAQNMASLNGQIERKTAFLNQMKEHRVLKKQEFELEKNKFKKDSTYYHKGGYGISSSDYEQMLLTYIKSRSEFVRYNASFESYEEEIIVLEQTLVKTRTDHKNEIISTARKVKDVKEQLLVSIKNWKDRYLLTSPIVGKVSFTKYWSENQATKAGDLVATVVPSDELSVFCRVMVLPQDVGKVTTGQQVNIKLASFPHMQYGLLRGEVSSISLVPLEGRYLVEVSLPKGIKTDYDIELPLIQEMTGIGEIITKEKRLIYKLVAGLEALRI